MGRRGRSQFGNLGHTFFITTTVVDFGRVFSCGDAYYEILLNSLKYVKGKYRATLYAFVFMPSHIHLVASVPEGVQISNLMRDFKKFTSTKIRQRLELDQESEWIKRLRANARGKKNQVFKLWMDRFDDVVIESEKALEVKVEYVHQNPVKVGLVETPEEWKYSSASNYLRGQGIIDIETDW